MLRMPFYVDLENSVITFFPEVPEDFSIKRIKFIIVNGNSYDPTFCVSPGK